MDRFLSRWKSNSDAATMGRVQPGLALQQDDEEEAIDSDDDMAQFIEHDDDDEDDDEVEEQEERKDTVRLVQSTGHVHKRVKLQMQLAGGSAAAARTKYKPGGEEPARSNVAAASSSSVAAASASRAASSSAARPAASASSSSQPALSRAQQNAQKLFQPRQQPNARPPAATASSAVSSSTARPAAAVSSSQPARAASSAAAAAPPALARAVSAPEPATQPEAAAAPAVARKRKHLAADDATPASRSLVDLIEDWSDDEEDAVGLQRGRSQMQLQLKPVPKPTPPPPPPPRHRSVLSMLHAVQSGTIPFASQQFARIARRRETRAEQKEEAARKALERGEELGDQTASMVSVGPFSSASAVAAAASSSSAAGASSAAASAAAAPCGSSMPHYASSHFRTSQVRHTELFHHSMKHLLWSRMSPVKDWSLCGDKAAAQFDRFAPPPPPSALSYVNQLRFDHQGALLCATSNNGLVDLYDFDDVWMAGRRVEKTKRTRELRAREEYRRVANLIRGRADSPPRSQKWKLNQPAPVLKPYASPSAPAHERIKPIFSMNLAATASDAAETPASQRSAQQAPILRQIDCQHWSPVNCNEIALSSQRSNQIYLFDVSRCDEQGSPHRRLLLGDSFTPAHASCVMDFAYFPAAAGVARSSGGGGNGGGKTLVAALRNGEINTLDLRVANGVASTDAPKLFKAQQRATTSNLGLKDRPNPPTSLQISACGNKLYVFTEQGTLESWDTRLMRATFERVHLLESMWTESHKHAPADAAGTLGMHQAVLGRVCSSSIHPQDDHALLFQLLSGAVGLVDLNPCSPSFQSVRTVVPHSAAFVSSALEDQFSLRPKRTAVFLHNGQSGSNASAKRERIVAAADMESRIRIIESCSASACRSPPAAARASSSDAMLDRELQRSSDSSSRAFSSALSPSMHLLHTLPPPSDDSMAARYSALPLSNPIMSLAAHPHAPYLLLGCKQQRIRIVAHEAELEHKMETLDIAEEAGK